MTGPKRIIPAEWAPQKVIWTAFPSHPELWPGCLDAARGEVAGMVNALATAGRVNVLAMGDDALGAARAALKGDVRVIPAKFGDIWLRDTGPIFAREGTEKVALAFRFNGWGGKYIYPFDDTVAAFIVQESATPPRAHDFVLEGGALEHDGEGTIITTRECLLNPNRNPGLSQGEVERRLEDAFGAEKIVWLEGGLLNDHTDGHVDNIARFIAPGHALCQSPSGADDPNRETLDRIAADLAGAGLKVSRMPSPGLVTDEDGAPVAASHMNYIIFNGVIVLPVYDGVHGAAAARALQGLFPTHRVVPLPARHILTGGGSFHCITQQEF